MLLLEATNSKRLIFTNMIQSGKKSCINSSFMTLHCLILVYSNLFCLFMFGSGRKRIPSKHYRDIRFTRMNRSEVTIALPFDIRTPKGEHFIFSLSLSTSLQVWVQIWWLHFEIMSIFSKTVFFCDQRQYLAK